MTHSKHCSKFPAGLLPTIVSVFLIFSSMAAQAAPLSRDVKALEQEFTNTYFTDYKSGACGKNIARLLERLQSQGVSIQKARAIVITNKGYMLSVTHRRGAGQKLAEPVNGIHFAPGAQNFYFHVALELEGRIYDYDFANAPEAPTLREYIERMFWLNPKGPSPGLEPLRERMNYEIAFVPAADFMRTLSAEGATKLDLSDVYDGLATGL